LFNALNTVYFRIDEKNTDAKNTVELLSELLRYQLYNMEEKVDISPDFVTGTPYSKTGHQIGGRSVYVDLSGA